MSPELSGAICGAVAAGVVTALIEIGKWFFGRRQQNKAIRIGFYFEINSHHITELEKDEDGQPNFVLTNFSDNVYKSNLSLVTKLFDSNLVQVLIFYYSRLTFVLDFQNKLEDVNSKIETLRINEVNLMGPTIEFKKLRSQRRGVLGTLRLDLAIAQNNRQYLLSELKKVFKEDPSKRPFIDVLPKHQEWFEKIQEEENRHSDH